MSADHAPQASDARWSARSRQRAVVCGLAADAQGQPFTRAGRLFLDALADRPARDRSRQAGRTTADFNGPTYRGHLRPDGRFHFNDVRPGRYALHRVDRTGAIVQTEDVVVKAYGPQTPMPVATVDLLVATAASS